MDIKEQIEKLVSALSKDASLKEQFLKDPVKTLEKVLGVDLPDDMVEKVVAGVKAKLSADQIAGAADMLKKLF